MFKDKNNQSTKVYISFIIGLTILLVVAFLYQLFNIVGSFGGVISDINIFIKSINILIGIMAICSCFLYYYSTKDKTIFIMTLMYIVLLIDIILGNLDKIFGLYNDITTPNQYFVLSNSLLRVVLIITAVSPMDRFKSFIIKNKYMSIFLSVAIPIILDLLEGNSQWLKYIRLETNLITKYHILLCIVYIIISIRLGYKSIKEQNFMYAVIMLSIILLAIKAVYTINFIEVSMVNIGIQSAILSFVVFLTLIGGLFLEAIRKIHESDTLSNKLKIFFKVTDDNYHNNVLIYNKNKGIVYINKRLREKYGNSYSNGSYKKTIESYINQEKNKKYSLEIQNNLKTNGYWKGNIELFGNEIYSLDVQEMTFEDDGIYVASYKNITEEHKLSNKLQLSENKLREVTENIKDLILTIDKSNNISYVNKAVLDKLGYKEHELIDRNILGLIGEIDSTTEILVKKDLYDKSILEHTFICKNQDLIRVESVVTNLIDSNNNFIGKIIVGRDIGYRKELEALKVKYQEVKEYERIKSEFFANLSHEFRTPINILYSCLQLLKNKQSINTNSEFEIYYRKYESTMKQNCFRMLRLVNNLIDITKIDTGFMKVDFCDYDIVNLIENITMSVIPYVESKKINIVFDTEIEELIIKCDPEKIERIILNLLSNAIKFTEVEGTIAVTICCDNEWVIIDVKDDGIGIPNHMKKLIFGRFIQNDKSLKRSKEGSGIGLALVKSLVDLHEGIIYIDERVNKGSEFVIKLPNKRIKDCDFDEKKLFYEPLVDKISIEFSDIYDINI